MPNVKLSDIVILKESYRKALIKERKAFHEAEMYDWTEEKLQAFRKARHAADRVLAQIEDVAGASRLG